MVRVYSDMEEANEDLKETVSRGVQDHIGRAERVAAARKLDAGDGERQLTADEFHIATGEAIMAAK